MVDTSETASLIDEKIVNVNNYITPPNDERDLKRKKRAVWKNLLVLAISFLMVYSSFAAIQNLQSTVNKDAGLGVIALSCFYASCVIASLFVPLMLKVFGCKGCVLSGFLAYGVYAVVNFYPTFYTLIPVCILQGVFVIPIGAAQGIYVTDLATQYADLTGELTSMVINRFNGIFFFFWQNTQIWGNVVSSVVLQNKAITNENDTMPTECGAAFCNAQTNISTLEHPFNELIYTLYGILLGMIVLGCVMTIVLVDRIGCDVTELSVRKACVEVISTHRDRITMLFIPLYFWTGYNLAFLSSEYTKVLGCLIGQDINISLMFSSHDLWFIILGFCRLRFWNRYDWLRHDDVRYRQRIGCVFRGKT